MIKYENECTTVNEQECNTVNEQVCNTVNEQVCNTVYDTVNEQQCSTEYEEICLAKIRTAARELLTLEDKDPKRLFEGNALLRRLVRIGVLAEDKMKLDYVLGLKTEDFLERRLQTQVFKLGLAKSIHHARVLIKQRHIRVRKQVVNIPSFIVRLDSQKHIDFSLKSPFGGGRPGRVKRKNLKKGANKEEEGDGDSE